MDPFTQRMLERAKLRREKLDSQKMELEQITPMQEKTELIGKRKPLGNFSDNEKVDEGRKDKEYITSVRKSKLQKLARLYSGNEENILVTEMEEEEEEDSNENAENKPQCKLNRLTELASKIKEWDNDMVRPVTGGANISKTPKEKPAGQISNPKKDTKQAEWDTSVVEKLRSQGFSRSESQSKLIYNFEENKKKFGKPTVDVAKNDKPAQAVPPKTNPPAENRGVVLKKVALFEPGPKEDSSVSVCPTKDPTELSVAERKALFEKGKGGAVMPTGRCFVAPPPIRRQVNDSRPNLRNIASPTNKPVRTPEKTNPVSSPVKRSFLPSSPNPKPIHTPEKTNPVPSPIKKNIYSPSTTCVPQGAKTDSPIPAPPPMPQVAPSPAKDSDMPRTTSGRLYPSLSNLDLTDENEVTGSEINSSCESNDQFYANMTLSDLLEVNKNNPTTPPNDMSFSKSKECQVLDKMDRLLEGVLEGNSCGSEEEDEDTAPSPPKMMKSSSFEYKSSTETPSSLLHTVSFYRKQQQTSCVSPKAYEEEQEEDSKSSDESQDETALVESKIQTLMIEVSKQQTIISQASQALNLCLSTVEFSGSGEQVEGERLLLLATHKRQACLNEIQRLKVEKSLRPGGGKNLTEKGDVTLTNISVKMKRDALRALAAAENLMYFVCLVKSDEQVLATPAVSTTRENLKDLSLVFPGQVKLEGLHSDFKITVEVYSLELNREFLPHDLKYHIASKKEKKLLTPIKSKKSESKLIKPHIQSPAGPGAVRTSNFQMCGYVLFSLKEVSRTQWILNKVPYVSPLEGTISMNIRSELRLNDEFRGFLTMFDDISGFGAWHRRWCLLSSHFISYWKYPDDENKKVPIGTIDLRTVITETVGLVSRDVCARLNTFLLESTRPRLPEDKNSLVLSVEGDVTTIRHLLSADSKQEMNTWCKKLNATLALLRSWKCNFSD